MPVFFAFCAHPTERKNKVSAFHCAFELFYCYPVMHLYKNICSLLFGNNVQFFPILEKNSLAGKFFMHHTLLKYNVTINVKTNFISSKKCECKTNQECFYILYSYVSRYLKSCFYNISIHFIHYILFNKLYITIHLSNR